MSCCGVVMLDIASGSRYQIVLQLSLSPRQTNKPLRSLTNLGFGRAWSNVDIFDGSVWTTGPSLNQSRHATGLAISCSCNQVHIASGSIAQGATLTATTETLFAQGIKVPCQLASIN